MINDYFVWTIGIPNHGNSSGLKVIVTKSHKPGSLAMRYIHLHMAATWWKIFVRLPQLEMILCIEIMRPQLYVNGLNIF